MPALAPYWCRHLEALERRKNDIPTSRLLEVRYEDLVVDPPTVLSDIFDFLGESSLDTSAAYTDGKLCESYLKLDPSHASLALGVVTSKIGLYRKRFRAREVEQFEAAAGRFLRRYGYETIHIDPCPAGSWEMALSRILEVGNWLWLRAKHVFSPRTYGQHIIRYWIRRFQWVIMRHGRELVHSHGSERTCDPPKLSACHHDN